MFETERLKVIPYKEIKVEDIFDYGSDPEVSKFIGWPLFKELCDAEKVYNNILDNIEKGTHAYYSLYEKNENKHIGSVMIFNMANGRGEIGCVFHKDYWRKGYGNESVRWMIDYGFDELELNRLHAHVIQFNEGSLGLLEKLGFIKEGLLREHYFVENAYYNGVCYGLLKREW